jgi:hypothetical protein
MGDKPGQVDRAVKILLEAIEDYIKEWERMYSNSRLFWTYPTLS